jgi:hypothetical protein
MATQRKITPHEVVLLENKRATNKFQLQTARYFVIVYLAFILGAMILGGISLMFPIKGTLVDITNFMMAISGIFSGPLGLIIGYYFRTEQEKTSD